MKLILTGNSNYAGFVTEFLQKSDYKVEWMDFKDALAQKDEQPIIYLPGNKVTAFLTDETYVEQTLTEKIKLLKKADIPVVFLLDQRKSASSELIRMVLLRAKALRERKRPLPVVVAATSMRCGVGDLEKLYLQARQSGVVFLKYDSASVLETDGGSQVVLTEGGNTYEIDAPVLVECEDADTDETAEFAKKKRIRSGEGKKYSGAKWFLPAGFTGRRNVWILDDDVLYDKPETVLTGVLQEVENLNSQPSIMAAEVDDTKCAFCYTCHRVCPHGAPTPDGELHAMRISVTLCEGCGMCKAVCPARAIELKNVYGENQAEDPYGNEKVLALCCENSAALVAKETFKDMQVDSLEISCGGEVNESRILQALKRYDKVLVAVCEKSACRHYDGNTRCELQVERAKNTLQTLGLDADRVALVKASFAAKGQIRKAAEAFVQNKKEEEK